MVNSDPTRKQSDELETFNVLERLRRNTGVIIVDHGSRQQDANEMLDAVAHLFRACTGAGIVECAHMELAQPSLEQAYARCVEQGAEEVVIQQFFLSPGRHSAADIPALAAAAAAKHPATRHRVTEPLGVDERIVAVMVRRIHECLAGE